MPENLLNLSEGLSNNDLQKATAVEASVIEGKTFYSGNKELKTGTLPDRKYPGKHDVVSMNETYQSVGFSYGENLQVTTLMNGQQCLAIQPPYGIYGFEDGTQWAYVGANLEDVKALVGSTVDLGVGQSFNVSGYPGYQSFTNSNFICETQNLDWTGGNYWTNGDVRSRACHKLIKSYNASSGVLTARAEVTGGINGGNTLTVNVHAYLKY